jgi:hypothetical protein
MPFLPLEVFLSDAWTQREREAVDSLYQLTTYQRGYNTLHPTIYNHMVLFKKKKT